MEGTTNLTIRPSRQVGLFSLPREVRDNIYRERLSLHKVLKREKSLALLLVNKQIHSEASYIWYDENKWIVVSFNFRNLATKIYPDFYYDRNHTFHCSHDESQDGELLLGRKPAVRVDVQTEKDLGMSADYTVPNRPVEWCAKPHAQEFLVTPLDFAETLFRSFYHIWKWVSIIENFRFTVSLSEGAAARQQCQDLILDFLDFRGVREATISGMEPPSVNKGHAALMMSRMEHVDEIYNRACVYHRRADQALAHGDSHEAEHIYQHGSLYLLKAEPAFLHHHSEVSQAVVRKRLLAKKLRLVMGYEIAAKTTYKPTPSEVNNRSWVLEEVNDMPDHEKAVAYLNKGLRHKSLADGSRKADTANKIAAYAFLHAYTLRPGWGKGGPRTRYA